MVSKSLFKTAKVVPVANVVNKAGGKAYSLPSKDALAKIIVTGCLNDTFYSDAGEQLAEIKKLCKEVEPSFIAKLAVYGRKKADMKDTPAYLLAYLFSNGHSDLVSKIFNDVVDNMKMLCNFVQIVRSGETGRKSFGTLGKRLINSWLLSRDADRMFRDNIGHSNPSVSDIVKMTHPKSSDEAQANMLKYILDKEYVNSTLPARVREFEDFKAGKTKVVPNVDFRLLSNIKLTEAQWVDVAKNMTWTTLRMNLSNLAKHGVFKDAKTAKLLADKLRDEDEVKKSRCFPYQLLTTFKNVDSAPLVITNALQDAMEVATGNVPSFNTDVAVCLDISGSMNSPVTGNRGSVTSKTTCRDVSGLIASVILRKNENTTIVPFHDVAVDCKLNPRDSVMTNTNILARLPSGGTSCSSALVKLNQTNNKSNLVIFVSDNMSWADFNISYRGTKMQEEWIKYKKRNPKAKLVLIDVTPNSTSQIQTDKSVLQIAGWSDECFKVISKFVNNEVASFVSEIEGIF